jgi:nucleotide-binding universal stress UspA family protein
MVDNTPLAVRHVLLPLDGSKLSAAALPTADALAARLGARLVSMAVGPARELQALRSRAVGSLGADGPHIEVEAVAGDDPAHAITARADELESCVVCMSTRGRGRVAGALIGSVARSVLRTCRQAVVTVGPQADRPPALVGRPPRRPRSWPPPLSTNRLVACVDGSPQSEAVLPVAARWASALAMRMAILTVAEQTAVTARGHVVNSFGPPEPAQYVEELAASWSEPGLDILGQVVFDPIGVTAGLTAHLASEPAGLVAVATRGRTGLDRIRLGATAADIVRTSPAPTLVVPNTSNGRPA